MILRKIVSIIIVLAVLFSTPVNILAEHYEEGPDEGHGLKTEETASEPLPDDPEPEVDDAIFLGCDTDPFVYDAPASYAEDGVSSFVIEEDTTLYEVWGFDQDGETEQIGLLAIGDTYTVTLRPGLRSNDPDRTCTVEDYGDPIKLGDLVTPDFNYDPPNPKPNIDPNSMSGWKFIGWDPPYDPETLLEGDLILTAQWVPDVYAYTKPNPSDSNKNDLH